MQQGQQLFLIDINGIACGSNGIGGGSIGIGGGRIGIGGGNKGKNGDMQHLKYLNINSNIKNKPAPKSLVNSK